MIYTPGEEQLIDAKQAEIDPLHDWLLLNRKTAPADEVKKVKKQLTQKLKELNSLLDRKRIF